MLHTLRRMAGKLLNGGFGVKPIFPHRTHFRWKSLLPWAVVLIQVIIITLLVVDHQQCLYLSDKPRPQPQGPGRFLGEQGPAIKRNLAVGMPVEVGNSPAGRIFYNRVPKCGSTAIMALIQEMGKRNNFSFEKTHYVYTKFHVTQEEQETLSRDIFTSIPQPMVFERHLHFVDFSSFGIQQPVYINVVRDPLERLVSWYYFRRYQEGHERDMPTRKRVRTYDECVLGNHEECTSSLGDMPEEGYFKIIPFFCGQAPECSVNSETALMKAIDNVKKYYLVVGYTEELYKFVQALEHLHPAFFSGASTVFNNISKSLHEQYRTTYKLPPSPEVIKIMRRKLKYEYQFFIFIKNRFRRLMEDIEAGVR